MNKTLSIFIRYLIVLLIALPNLFLIYFIFEPLTVYPVYFFLSFFYSVVLNFPNLIVQGTRIEIIPACIAGSAYYFLIALNLLTPMRLDKRIKALFFTIALFLIINIMRIFLFSHLYISDFSLFDLTHALTWNVSSTLLLISLWFASVSLFKIKHKPIITDFSYLIKESKR